MSGEMTWAFLVGSTATVTWALAARGARTREARTPDARSLRIGRFYPPSVPPGGWPRVADCGPFGVFALTRTVEMESSAPGRPMNKKTLLATAAAAALFAPSAQAQTAPGFNADRFNPSERGSEWFSLDPLDLRGDPRPAVGMVAEYANAPFTLKTADGSTQTVVTQQMFLHFGASLVLVDRLRIGFNLPVGILDQGTQQTGSSGQVYGAPIKPALGDFRIGADLRLVGQIDSPFTLAV